MNIIDKFKLFLVKGNRRASTVAGYCDYLQRFLKNVVGEPTKDSVEKWCLDLLENGRKATYVNKFIDTFRLYGQCFEIEELKKLDYFPEIEPQKATMSDEEIEAFLSLPPVIHMRKSRWGELMPVTYTNHYAFWTLFYSVLAFTGMRPGELAGMTVDRVDFGQKVFLLRSEDVKTKTSRLVPIPERVSKQLYEYVQTLKGEYLFPSQRTKNRKTGKPTIDDVDWGYNFHTRINRLGIKRAGLTPYSLRHSIITRLLDEDVNLFRVQRLVGHSQIATTAHYYHHSTKALQQTVQKDPLARKTTTTQEVFNQLVEHVHQFILGDKRFVLSVDRTKPQEMKLKITTLL